MLYIVVDYFSRNFAKAYIDGHHLDRIQHMIDSKRTCNISSTPYPSG